MVLSNSILKRESILRKKFGEEYFQEEMAENLLNEISASWEIENILI